MRAGTEIAVCGAGLGGLTAAVALQQRGFRVTVHEQARALGEVGAGLQLSSNAVRVLADLGLEQQLIERASLPEGKQVRLWNTGEAWKLFDLGPLSMERYGHPYLMMHRADLHAVLSEAFLAAGGQLQLGHQLAGFDQDESGVVLRFTDGSQVRADLLVGADGVHSVVRGELFGEVESVFSGCVAWRGVVDAAALPAHLRSPVGTNWIGPHGHVIQYLLRRGELVNFVGIVERSDWTVESWNAAGTTEECLADFRGWHPDVLTLIEAIDVPMKWALNLRPPLPTWTVGRATLLGDACHPTLPFLAQGACMAIEDGLVLARALDAHESPSAGFAAYEAARVTRTTAVVEGSAANAGRFHNPLLSDPVQAADYVADEWSPDKVARRYEWLFEYDAVAVPVDTTPTPAGQAAGA